MNQSRLEQLLQFYKEDPNDPFTLYALANEYKTVDLNIALAYYEKLINFHPEYIPTYFHLAQLYLDLGEEEKAKVTYENGIEKASKSNENLMLRELKNAYNEFMMDR